MQLQNRISPKTPVFFTLNPFALTSLQQVLASRIDHELRTTVHPALLTDAELGGLARELAARGAKHYVMQGFRSLGCGDQALCQDTARDRPLQDVGRDLAGLFEVFSVRA